jgi:fibronectin-binding autotransporter adhesin
LSDVPAFIKRTACRKRGDKQMATTISSSGTVGVTLTTASQNPVLVTGGGTIDVAGNYASAIYGYFGIVGTITNDGLLEAPNGYGIFLRSGGSITNGSTLATGAKITGGVDAVRIGIHGPGTVDNFGTMASTGSAQGVGVLALGNASVVNGSPADTSALISGYSDGVEILGSGATVSNFGTITATGTSTIVGSSSFGVYLAKGGDRHQRQRDRHERQHSGCAVFD